MQSNQRANWSDILELYEKLNTERTRYNFSTVSPNNDTKIQTNDILSLKNYIQEMTSNSNLTFVASTENITVPEQGTKITPVSFTDLSTIIDNISSTATNASNYSYCGGYNGSNYSYNSSNNSFNSTNHGYCNTDACIPYDYTNVSDTSGNYSNYGYLSSGGTKASNYTYNSSNYSYTPSNSSNYGYNSSNNSWNSGNYGWNSGNHGYNSSNYSVRSRR